MNPWIVILLVTAVFAFALDYLFRRKKWKDNSKEEKISLLLSMFSVGPYIFLSLLGMMLGIVAYSPKTSLGVALNKATLLMASTYFAVAAVAAILAFVFRKKGKIKESIWVNIIALVYIVAVMVVNTFAGKVL